MINLGTVVDKFSNRAIFITVDKSNVGPDLIIVILLPVVFAMRFADLAHNTDPKYYQISPIFVEKLILL